MRKYFVLVPLGLILLAALVACASKAATPNPQNVLFFDNFSQTNGSWTKLQDDTGSMGYNNNHYDIFVKNPNTMLMATAGKSFQGDVSIEVDARKIGGSDNNYFGVLCRYKDPDNYYMFLITSDGLSGILMDKAGNLQMISPGGDWLKMDGIKKGTVTNHIRVDCIGDALTVYANGKQVSDSYDRSFTGGDVGLVARSSRIEGGVNIQFDNFVVSKPSQP